MKKKVRVDFSAHCSVVVEVEDTDDYYDRASELAEEYLLGNKEINPSWEPDDGGIDDADDFDVPDVRE